MSVISACTFLSLRRPMPTIICARRRASTCFFMKAPLPTLTSRTSASRPAASFLDMMEDAISGMDSTVAVASRSEYSLPSAGATSGVCPMNARRCWINCSRNSSTVRLVRKPGNRFQLVQRAAGVAQGAPRDHRNHHARRGRQRRRNQTGLIAHAAGGMLVHLHAGHRGEVDGFAGLDHALGKGADFAVRHSRMKYSHEKRRHLIIRDAAVGIAVNEEGDFFYG